MHVISGILWKISLNVSVQQGQNPTLRCPLMPDSSKGVLSWYKQTPWHLPQLILSYNNTNISRVRYGTVQDHSRYAVLTRGGLNPRHFLQIITTLQTDTGTYYCGFSDKNQMHMFDDWMQMLHCISCFRYLLILNASLCKWTLFMENNRLFNTISCILFSISVYFMKAIFLMFKYFWLALQNLQTLL